MSDLQHHDFSDSPARCAECHALAAGPCARCEAPLCGDCCVIVRGGSRPWAVCPRCASAHRASIGGGWRLVLGWLAGPLALLLLAVIALAWLTGR